MKLRGLLPNLLILISAGILLGGIYFFKTQKNELANDMKNELTDPSQAKPRGLKAIIAKGLEKQDEMVERKEFGENVLERERVFTEKEITDMTEEQFVELVKETENKLPKLSDIRKLPPGALHRTPVPVIQAGKDLGLLKEVLKAHESYERVVLPMYQNCAKNSERPTPVRALCLTDLIQLKKKNGEKINTADYPKELVDLSRMVTDL